MEYLKKAMDFLEKCELESPYSNSVDIQSAKIALEIVELEHEIEEARQLHHLEDMEELIQKRDQLAKKVKPEL